MHLERIPYMHAERRIWQIYGGGGAERFSNLLFLYLSLCVTQVISNLGSATYYL